MSRKIKFRAFAAGIMYPSVGVYEDRVIEVDGEDLWFWNEQPENDFLKEYTGIDDRDGAEIYEGDIYTASIGGDKQEYPFLVKDLRTFYERLDTIDGYLRIDKNSIKVIGNIHQHPELLKDNHDKTTNG